MLRERILSAIIGAPLVLAIAYLGGWPLFALVLCLSLAGMYELSALFARRNVHTGSWFYAVGVAALLSAMIPGFELQAMVLAVGITGSMALEVGKDSKNVTGPMASVFSVAYVPFLFSFLLRLSLIETRYAVLVVICTWATDTFAYFVGMRFGKHRMAPTLSPKKSWEGSAGGLLGAILVGLAACYTLGINSTVVRLTIPVAVGVSAQVGDLAESALKRFCEAKDSGNVIPGHGGVLDRFDSMIFAAPTAYILLRLLSLGGGLK